MISTTDHNTACVATRTIQQFVCIYCDAGRQLLLRNYLITGAGRIAIFAVAACQLRYPYVNQQRIYNPREKTPKIHNKI
jgi:hypothetical protein